MANVVVDYQGNMRSICRVGNMPEVVVDAIKTIGGLEEYPSPTDLFAASLGSCVMTMIALAANRAKHPIEGAKVTVEKKLTSSRPYRMESLVVDVSCPAPSDEVIKDKLIKAAEECPVHNSIDHDVNISINFQWT